MNKKILIRSLNVLLILLVSWLAIPTPTTASDQTTTECKQWHTVQSGEYLSLIANTYDVNWRDIAEINNIESPYTIYSGQKLCISGTISETTTSSDVKVYALSVQEDKSVSLKGVNLLPNTGHTIYFSNEKGSEPVRYYVGVVVTDSNGEFKDTYDIPSELVDYPKIRVTLIDTTGSSTYNWFFNADVEGNTGGQETPELSAVIDSSKKNRWFIVKVKNLPPNIPCDIYVGKEGDPNVLVGTIVSPTGGNETLKFNFRLRWIGKSTLDLKVENKPYELSANLTFENITKE